MQHPDQGLGQGPVPTPAGQPDGAALLFGLSGLAWIGAFGLFAILYGPLLMGRTRR